MTSAHVPPQHNSLLRFMAERALEKWTLIDGRGDRYLHYRATFNNCPSEADLLREIYRAFEEANLWATGRPYPRKETAQAYRRRKMAESREAAEQPSPQWDAAAERAKMIMALKAEGKKHREIGLLLPGLLGLPDVVSKNSIDQEVWRINRSVRRKGA